MKRKGNEIFSTTIQFLKKLIAPLKFVSDFDEIGIICIDFGIH